MLETRSLSQPGPSSNNSRVSWTANENKHQASVEIPVPVNFDKVNDTTSNNKKCSYKELYGNSIPSSSKKRSYEESFGNGASSNNKKRNYEELFGDISDLLDTDVPGMVID